jgi:putative transposase
MKRQRRRPIQQELPFRTHGGRRERKRELRVGKRRVPHRARPKHDENHPVHVTMRAGRLLPSLRKQMVFVAIRRALAKTSREWFRVVQFSVQTDHIHMIVETVDTIALSRGMRGVSIRLARRINRAAGRKGNVFGDRYHARALGTPREVRHCFVYVLLNFRKHLGRAAAVDPASSGFWFHGWKTPPATAPPSWESDEVVPVQPPRTWLARKGWQKYGLIDVTEQPKS